MSDPLAKYFQWEHPEYSKIKDFLCGIECEVEDIKAVNNEGSIREAFDITQDHSLRNNGFEFISFPETDLNVIESFKNLHANLDFRGRGDPFSSRTSTHVHINCRTLTTEQLHQLMLFYALYEECFFSMVDPIRRENIHCVPLTETFLPSHYQRGAPNLVKTWQKYTAFNMLPIASKGTVEFRHLQGTNDPLLLQEWLTIIRNLWNLAQEEVITADNVVKPENHYRWFDRIFSQSEKIRTLRSVMPNMIQNNLIDIKMAV